MSSVLPSAPPTGGLLRRHAPFGLALLLGLAVRAVVMVAYHPAMLFTDSFDYLTRAHHLSLGTTRPAGYPIFLWPIAHLTDSLTTVVVVQHLVGLALAVACYVFLLRRGLPGWGATLAVLPLLLDPLQLVLEHYILSDVVFELVLVVGCLVLLWRPRPSLGAVLLAGALIGSTGLVRGAGSFVIAVFLVALVCLRVSWVRLVAFAVAAVLPLAAYAFAFHQQRGEYAVATAGPRFLYARLAPIVHCQGLQLPRYERPLCPREPVGQRHDGNYYMWGGAQVPQFSLRPPAGRTQMQVVKDFDKRVVRAQPKVYAEAVLKDVVRGFAPTRTYDVPGYPSSYWLFADHYWSLDAFSPTTRHRAEPFDPGYHPTAAQVMTTYRHWIYTPGPLAAALLLVAAAATAGLGRSRLSGHRVAIGLLTAACAVPILTGAALSGFSWRYQLPQIPLLPVAGALALTALVRGRRPSAPALDPPLRVLDRLAAGIGRLPVPVAWRTRFQRGTELGLPQAVLAVLAGALAAVGATGLVVASTWATPRPAAFGGVVVGLLVTAGLLVARWRAGPLSAADAGGPPGASARDEQDDRVPAGP